MKKTILIMTIIAVALASFSLILLLASIPFQSLLAREVYRYSENILEELPAFPLVSFLLCFLRVSCIALLIVCCANKKDNVWLELIILICLVVIIPAIRQIASPLYSAFLGHLGSQRLIANSLATNIASFCLIPSNLGLALAHVTCGMSIAFKKININTNHAVINEEINL